MIIVRAPLRISLFGGGTDIDPYLTEFGSEILSFSINKYIYLTAHPLIETTDVMLKYSINERVADLNQIKHPVFREILKAYNLRSIDISVSSDIAAGTGMGSSSSFTVGLIHLINAYLDRQVSKVEIAQEACAVEIDQLKEPIGIQDQFAAAIGGLNHFKFNSRKDISISPIYVDANMCTIFKKNSVLIRIPGTRSAGTLLRSQTSNDNIANLHKMKSIVTTALESLKNNPLELGTLLNETWQVKKKLSPLISTAYIDNLYDSLISAGFYGGKLLGAGNSGYLFMMGPAELISDVKSSMNFETLDFELDSEGSKVIYNSGIS